MSALLAASGLGVDYRGPRGLLRALSDVTLTLGAGETLGVVGESGSGKSTLGRALLRLVPASAGTVQWQGRDVTRLGQRALRPLRRDLQVVFQNPLASLDPRQRIGASVAEPLGVHQPGLPPAQAAQRVAAMLERVGLAAALASRLPHELSGGQAQRVAIARAMLAGPRVVICDEAVSALDVSVQAQIVNLLLDLQRESATAYVFISHNLAVVRRLAARVLVLYRGRVVEQAPRERLYSLPAHPYTRLLLDSVPSAADPAAQRRAALAPPELASPFAVERGCVFAGRCAHATPHCRSERPPIERVAPGHEVACWRWREDVARR